MARIFVIHLMVCLIFSAMASKAQAKVLTFDYPPGAAKTIDLDPITNVYGGLNWDQMFVIQKDFNNLSGYRNGTILGEWMAYKSYYNMATVSVAGKFDFKDAFIASTWDSTDTLTIHCFLGMDQLYNVSLAMNNLNPIWHQADFLGVDRVTFNTGRQQFAADNFTYNEAAQIQEPSTFIYLGAGIIGLAVLRKRNA